jgi:hypothetical protein
MAMFETEVMDGKSPYKDMKLGDQANGFSCTFYYDNKTSATSQEYGEFEILQGVGFDHTLATTEAMLAGAELISLIPNTMLKNLIANGGMVRGEAYIVTKKWTKGDAIPNSKQKAKGHGYEVQRIKAPDVFLDSLKAKHKELLPEGMGTENVAATPAVDI